MPKRKKILIALNEQTAQEIITILKEIGYENLVICEPNRHAILSQTTQALMRNHPFDLLIIEQIMDSGTGIDVLNNYRTRHYNETPIIIVFEQEPDMLQNLSVNHLRFAACLTAPFDIKILTVAIKCITHHNA